MGNQLFFLSNVPSFMQLSSSFFYFFFYRKTQYGDADIQCDPPYDMTSIWMIIYYVQLYDKINIPYSLASEYSFCVW